MEEGRNLADVLSWVSSAQDEVLRCRQRVGRHPGYNNDFAITWLRHSPAEELQLVLGDADGTAALPESRASYASLPLREVATHNSDGADQRL